LKKLHADAIVSAGGAPPPPPPASAPSKKSKADSAKGAEKAVAPENAKPKVEKNKVPAPAPVKPPAATPATHSSGGGHEAKVGTGSSGAPPPAPSSVWVGSGPKATVDLTKLEAWLTYYSYVGGYAANKDDLR